ncbi:cytochrome P450, partial [Apiospora sp. TS-2023a]
AYLFSCKGGLIRIGPNHLVTSDIDSILRINSPISGYSGGLAPSCSSQGHCSFSCPDGKKRIGQATSFRYKGDSHMETIVDRQCNRHIRCIEEEFSSTKRGFTLLDMAPASRWLVSNIHRDLAFGELGEPCVSVEEGQGRCDMSGTKRKTLTRLLAALLPVWVMRGSGSRGEHDLAQDHLKRHWAVMTADALTTIIIHLLSSPAAYDKLKTEVGRSFIPGNRLPATPPIPGAMLPLEMPYLHAVVKEGCRMSDAMITVPTVFRNSPGGSDTILGFRIPVGTEVGSNLLGIMRAKKYWGGDAEVFRPERWLEANNEKSSFMMKSALDIMWGNMGSVNGHPPRAVAEKMLSKALALVRQENNSRSFT